MPYSIFFYFFSQKIKKQKGECCVVEVGGGLAEILRNLDSKVRFGFDLDKKVLSAAKILSFGRENIKYQEDTFEDVNINMPIDYLCAVNFPHMIEPEVLKRDMYLLCNNNYIANIVVERVVGNGYRYAHDWRDILPKYYSRSICSPEFYFAGNMRIVEIWRR